MQDTTGELLMAAARQLRRRFADSLADWEITPAQARALRLVCDHEPVRLSVLAEKLRIAPRSATEVVDALAEHRLVEREPDPSDRRAVCVRSTAAGAEICREIVRARRASSRAYLAALSTEDRAQLDRILRHLVAD